MFTAAFYCRQALPGSEEMGKRAACQEPVVTESLKAVSDFRAKCHVKRLRCVTGWLSFLPEETEPLLPAPLVQDPVRCPRNQRRGPQPQKLPHPETRLSSPLLCPAAAPGRFVCVFFPIFILFVFVTRLPPSSALRAHSCRALGDTWAWGLAWVSRPHGEHFPHRGAADLVLVGV